MSRLLDRYALFYPMRIVATGFMVVVTSLYASQFDAFGTSYYVVAAILVVYPHVVHSLTRRHPQSRPRIELRTFLFDSFVVGLVVASTGFTPLPTFILMTVALASSLSVNGLSQMLAAGASVVVGVAAYAAFVGLDFAPKDSLAIDVACSVFLFVYFMAFAYSAHNRNALLLESQTELREQKASLEIEKLRSDRLLFNLLPTRLALEMAKPGGIRAAEFDPVTLLAIELRPFSRMLQANDGQEVLAHLMHCFKAFDAIGDRWGLEKLKTMGDIYIAVAGLPVPGPGDAAAAVEAALGVREFLGDFAEARRAHGQFVLEAGISVHSGKVIGAVVETSKISYDVFGGTVRELLRLLRTCPDGEIVVSEAARRLAGDRFEWSDAALAGGGSGVERAAYGVRQRAASPFPAHA